MPYTGVRTGYYVGYDSQHGPRIVTMDIQCKDVIDNRQK